MPDNKTYIEHNEYVNHYSTDDDFNSDFEDVEPLGNGVSIIDV